MIANMGKEGKYISVDTLAQICEALDCGIIEVIELVSNEPSTTRRERQRKNCQKELQRTALIIFW